jgi:hypothetical protein
MALWPTLTEGSFQPPMTCNGVRGCIKIRVSGLSSQRFVAIDRFRARS